MKKAKYLLLAFTLILGFSFLNVNAVQLGINKTNVQTKEDLVYLLKYHNADVTLTGNTVKLNSDVTFNVDVTFSNTEELTIDLNSHGITFTGGDFGMTMYNSAKKISFIDSSANKTGYLKSDGDFAMYTSSPNGVSFKNVKVIGNSSKAAIYTYGGKVDITNSVVQANYKGIIAGANSTITILSSSINLGNPTGVYGIDLEGTNANVTVTDTNITNKVSSTGIGIYQGIATDSNLTFNSGTIESSADALQINNGTARIKTGTFTSTIEDAVIIAGGTTIINNGTYTGQKHGIQVSGGQATIQNANVTGKFNHGIFVSGGVAYINNGTYIGKSAGLAVTSSALTNIVKGKFIISDTAGTSGKGGIAIPASDMPASVISTVSETDCDTFLTYSGYKWFANPEVNIFPSISKAYLGLTEYTYNGYVKNPKLTVLTKTGSKLVKGTDYTTDLSSGRKYVGTYFVKVTYKGLYSNYPAKKLYFKINPRSTYITKLTSGNNKFTVNYAKRTTQTTGYRIMYATNSSFKGYGLKVIKGTKTTSKTIYAKNKKKYYVKVRAYKVVNGKTYYSAWSKVKTVTTR